MPIGAVLNGSGRANNVTSPNIRNVDFYQGTTNGDKLYYDPLVVGHAMIIFTRFPKWVEDTFPQARALFQKNFAGFDGIQDIEIGTADVQEGFSQNAYQIAQNIGAKSNNFSLKHLEYSGSLISQIYTFWVSGIRDPDTGIATYPKRFGLDYAAYNHTCELMYIVLRPDANNYKDKNIIEFAAYWTAAMPKKIPMSHFNYSKASQNAPIEIDQNFSGIQHIGPAVDFAAQKLLESDRYRMFNVLEAADYTYYGDGKFGHNEDNSTNGQASSGNYNTQGTDLVT